MTVVNEELAAGHIHGICLKTGPPRRVGVELEWLVRDVRDPALPVSAERVAAAVADFAARPAPSRSPSAASATPAGRAVPAGGLPTSAVPGVLPSGALLTTEPGGQLELSSLPADSLPECVRATAADLAALRAATAAAGLELAGIGLDPYRRPLRVLDLPRYAAMEAFFDADGPWGREMMCATASVQVCLDAGDDSDGFTGYRWRWRLLHAIGPVLVAAFANSPLRDGRPSGWRSSRQQVWWHMPADRTRPPLPADWLGEQPHNGNSPHQTSARAASRPARENSRPHDPGPGSDADLRTAWADYALDARVMCVREGDAADWSAPPGLTLRDWVRGDAAAGQDHEPAGDSANGTSSGNGNGNRSGGPAGHGAGGGRPAAGSLRRPTAEDVGYHLTTLFPPVRPRGHFELRVIDAQPGDGWVVPLAVTTALLADENAAEAAMAAAVPLWGGHRAGGPSSANGADPWLRAARLGPADPALARASRQCFAAARAALDLLEVPAAITGAVDDFIRDYVSKDRCPADDLLEEAE
jgi:glutamate--cysteine ligase